MTKSLDEEKLYPKIYSRNKNNVKMIPNISKNLSTISQYALFRTKLIENHKKISCLNESVELSNKKSLIVLSLDNTKQNNTKLSSKTYNIIETSKQKVYKLRKINSNNKFLKPAKITPFITELNKNLGTIHNSYGKIESLKNFKDNPLTQFYYDHNNYVHYRLNKSNERVYINRPKLKPMKLRKDPSIETLAKNIFYN